MKAVQNEMSQSHEKFRGVLMGVAKAPGDTGKIHAKLGQMSTLPVEH